MDAGVSRPFSAFLFYFIFLLLKIPRKERVIDSLEEGGEDRILFAEDRSAPVHRVM